MVTANGLGRRCNGVLCSSDRWGVSQEMAFALRIDLE